MALGCVSCFIQGSRGVKTGRRGLHHENQHKPYTGWSLGFQGKVSIRLESHPQILNLLVHATPAPHTEDEKTKTGSVCSSWVRVSSSGLRGTCVRPHGPRNSRYKHSGFHAPFGDKFQEHIFYFSKNSSWGEGPLGNMIQVFLWIIISFKKIAMGKMVSCF